MPFQPISKQQQDQMQNQAVNISGGGGASFQDVVPGQEKKSEKSSGQYANLQQYIQANQPQAQAMGQKVSQGVEQSGQEATQKVEQFGTQKPSVAAFDPNAYIQRAPELSQEEKTTYQTTKQTGGYTGPDSLEKVQGYTEAEKAAKAASEKAKLAGSETGQQELLRQTFARPNYTQGQTNLDQVLLGGNQQAKQSLSDLSSRYSDLYNVFNQKAEDVGVGINQANQQALANRQGIMQAETQAWTDLLNPLEQRAKQANIERPQVQQAIFDDVSDDLLLQDTLQRLGLSEGQKLYDLNLSNYLNPNQTQVGINDVANQQERQKYAALASLFEDPTRTQIGEQGNMIPEVSFNRQGFESDLAKRQAEYETTLNKPSSVVNGKTIAEAKEMIPQIQAYIDSYKQIGSGAALQTAAFYERELAKIMEEQNSVMSYNPNRAIGVQL
jgi:hypothetical protein